MRPHASDVLVIENEPACPPGVLTQVLDEADLDLHRVRPYRGDPMPADLRGMEGLVVLGGTMSTIDEKTHPWLVPTRALLRTARERHLPALGVGLGAQLAAHALEGRIARGQQPRAGLRTLQLTEDGASDPLLSTLEEEPLVFAWHQDEIARTPPKARVLARDADGSVLAYRVGESLWGLQFHPEVTGRIAHRWASTSELLPNGQSPDEVRAQLEEATAAQQTWRALLAAFADQVHTG